MSKTEENSGIGGEEVCTRAAAARQCADPQATQEEVAPAGAQTRDQRQTMTPARRPLARNTTLSARTAARSFFLQKTFLFYKFSL